MKVGICNYAKCGKVYQKTNNRQQYCSRSCSCTVSNLRSPKRKAKLGTCKYCSTQVINISRRSICDICFRDGTHTNSIFSKKWQEMENLTVEQLKSMSLDNQRPWTDRVRGSARSWFPSKDQTCAQCGYSKHVEVCHIRAITSFPNTALLKEINCVENIMYLCPNCHWEFDNL